MNPPFKFISICLCLIFVSELVGGWGFWAHKRINRMAVFILPSGMIGFYKKNIEYLTEHAIDPDKRRYAVKEEASHHYIDLDRYGKYPYKEMPRTWKGAVAKYSEDTLMAHGIVPWQVDKMMYQLTDAFKQKNKKRILRLCADIGHYIADAHVPLHTTKNYNGQLTNQHGIHGFWEGRIPELFGENYDYFVGKATYIKNPLDKIWEIVLESNHAVDSVLLFERDLRKTFPADKQYVNENKGQSTVKSASEAFSKAYSDKLNGMVERRMRQSILEVASFWFTAWVNAGQPELSNLKEDELTEEEKKQLEEEEKKYRNGKILGQEHEN